MERLEALRPPSFSDTEILKLRSELMTNGVSVGNDVLDTLTNMGEHAISTGDYATTSGVSLVVGEGEDAIWLDVPFKQSNPNFIGKSAAKLVMTEQGLAISTLEGLLPAQYIPPPAYHNEKNPWGVPYSTIASTHMDRVRVSPANGCSLTCNFCDIPFTSGYQGIKDGGQVVESVSTALNDRVLPASHVMISGGTPRRIDYDKQHEMYMQIADTFPNVDVDIMMVPMPGLLRLEELKQAGINGLCINIELYNERAAKELMLNKFKASRKHYFDFIEEAVKVFGEGKVRSLILVGLESMEDTLKGVEELAERGCDPTLSPFRPDPNTPLAYLKPPTADFLVETYERSHDIISKRRGVVLGPRCIPCSHNTLTVPRGDGYYYS